MPRFFLGHPVVLGQTVRCSHSKATSIFEIFVFSHTLSSVFLVLATLPPLMRTGGRATTPCRLQIQLKRLTTEKRLVNVLNRPKMHKKCLSESQTSAGRVPVKFKVCQVCQVLYMLIFGTCWTTFVVMSMLKSDICPMSSVKGLCWSLGHAEQLLFSCLSSKVTVKVIY